MMSATTLLVVHWEWGPKSKHAGARFWAAHSTDIDGRIADWPNEDLIPLGASEVTVSDGHGLHLMQGIAERTEAQRKDRGWPSGSVRNP